MGSLVDKVKDKARMGKDLLPPAKLPLMRNPMMPMAVMGRSPQSQAQAMERMRGITEREKKMKRLKFGLE